MATRKRKYSALEGTNLLTLTGSLAQKEVIGSHYCVIPIPYLCYEMHMICGYDGGLVHTQTILYKTVLYKMQSECCILMFVRYPRNIYLVQLS